MAQKQALAGKRLGVFGKGGSGKSTITVLLARALLDQGYQVCVLDADSTNLGLPQAFDLPTPEKTLLDYFGGMVFQGGAVTCPVDDPTPLAQPEVKIEELPMDYFSRDEKGLILLSVGKIAGLGAGAGCDGPVAKIARDLRVQTENGRPVTILDFKAGFEDSARGVVTGLDCGLAVVDPTQTSLVLAGDLLQLVRQLKRNHPPATAHLENNQLVSLAKAIYSRSRIQEILVILNKIEDEATRIYLQDQLEEKELQISASIPADPSIAKAWLKGDPIVCPQAQAELGKVIAELERIFSNS